MQYSVSHRRDAKTQRNILLQGITLNNLIVNYSLFIVMHLPLRIPPYWNYKGYCGCRVFRGTRNVLRQNQSIRLERQKVDSKDSV